MRELREIINEAVTNPDVASKLESDIMGWHHKQIRQMNKAPMISEITTTPVKGGTKVEFVAKSVSPVAEFEDRDWNEFLDSPS